jgi:hypothetical protein
VIENSQMVNRKKNPIIEESEGEKFSDFSDDSAGSTIEDPLDDGWVFPVVPLKAKRDEYETVREDFPSQ